MAQVFKKYVHSGNLKLLVDSRQKGQILSVNNDLKAPETPLGHGDAFFSIAMALQAAHDSGLYQFQTLGNVMDWFTDDTNTAQSIPSISDELQSRWNEDDDNPSSIEHNNMIDLSEAPNVLCDEPLCNPTYWVKERNLCLYCGHRG